MKQRFTKPQLFLIATIVIAIGTFLTIVVLDSFFQPQTHALAQTAVPESNSNQNAPSDEATQIPSNSKQEERTTQPEETSVPSSEQEEKHPEQVKKLIRKEPPDWDDSDEDIREYDEEEKLGLPRLVRGNLMLRIQKQKSVKLENILKLNDADKMHDALLQSLEKNSCKTDSEDFIISSDNNIMMLQTKLEEMNYQDLFDAIYEKHLNGNTCKGNARFTRWSVMDILGLTHVDPETNEKYRTRVLSCHNGSYKNYNNLLDINLLFQVVLKGDKTQAVLVFLMWSEAFLDKLKHYEDYEMDPHLIFGIDSKKTSADNLIFTYEGALLIANNALDYKDILIDAMLQGEKIHLVYGKYIPDTKTDKLYFILSFRTYSLTEMRKTCSFLENYRSKDSTALPDDLRPVTSPYKSKNDPDRWKHKTHRPKHIKLPF